MKVLILEDQALIVMDIEDTLPAHGFEVAAMLSSCALALEWLKTGIADLVLLDIELTDGICIEVAKTLTERKIPFVVHSGSLPSSPTLIPSFNREVGSEADLIAAIGVAAAP